MPSTRPQEIRLPALEVCQGEKRRLYSFAVDGKALNQFSTVSRIRRDDDRRMFGYQRPEVRSHIREIKNYIESDNPMIPNALVIAFDDRVRFEAKGKSAAGYSRHGEIVIPIDLSWADDDKPGWIVDGQQRAAAMRDAKIDGAFPVCVTAFITPDEEEQREQFILVNSTKPLPKGLIHELLPETNAKLASHLQKRRFPVKLLTRLNFDEDSPFHLLIQTPTTPLEKHEGKHYGIIKDTSILKMIENSLSEGVLYWFRDPATGMGDEEKMLEALKNFWGAAAELFPEAWALPPRKSRLMHGAGIVSMGFLMDAIADKHRGKGVPSRAVFAGELKKIAPMARWTAGSWVFGRGMERKWNEIQNTGKDISILTHYLLSAFRRKS